MREDITDIGLLQPQVLLGYIGTRTLLTQALLEGGEALMRFIAATGISFPGTWH